MKIFDKTYKKVCKIHGISFLWFKSCKECDFEKNNPTLKKEYIHNLTRNY